MHGAGMFVDGNTGPLQLGAQQRLLLHFPHHATNPLEQDPIVELWIAYLDAVSRHLAHLAHQPRRVGKGSNRDRAIVGCHAPQGAAGHKGSGGAKVSGSQRREDAGRSGPDDEDAWNFAGH